MIQSLLVLAAVTHAAAQLSIVAAAAAAHISWNHTAKRFNDWSR